MARGVVMDRWGGAQEWTRKEAQDRMSFDQSNRRHRKSQARNRQRNADKKHYREWIEFNIKQAELKEMKYVVQLQNQIAEETMNSRGEREGFVSKSKGRQRKKGRKKGGRTRTRRQGENSKPTDHSTTMGKLPSLPGSLAAEAEERAVDPLSPAVTRTRLQAEMSQRHGQSLLPQIIQGSLPSLPGIRQQDDESVVVADCLSEQDRLKRMLPKSVAFNRQQMDMLHMLYGAELPPEGR